MSTSGLDEDAWQLVAHIQLRARPLAHREPHLADILAAMILRILTARGRARTTSTRALALLSRFEAFVLGLLVTGTESRSISGLISV